MEWKDILVHVDGDRSNAARLSAAVDLATEHGAHVTGLYVITHPQMPAYMETQLGPDFMTMEAEKAAAAADEAHARFEEVVAASGLEYEWRCVEGAPADVISLHGRHADLAIVGQYDPDGDGLLASSNGPDTLILGIGRPVLVVPYIGTHETIGESVMVAWDASRMSVRAVGDALPILQRAKQVKVLSVNPNGNAGIPGADICLHLARHGVRAEAMSTHAEDIDTADVLLSRLADAGSDMLVMGAYGHHRLRELVLGGVTRHILGHMTVPVLMSH